MQKNHRNDHGLFCTWCYQGPAKRARGFWHGQDPITVPRWAYALRSADGTFWETSRARGGFENEAAAIEAAQAAIAARGQA